MTLREFPPADRERHRDPTVAGLVANLRDNAAGRPVLLGPGLALNGRALWLRTRRDVRVLRRSGARPGSRIGLVSGNGPEAALAFLAIAQTGICVPVNPHLTAGEMAEYLSTAAVDILAVTGTADMGKVESARRSRPVPSCVLGDAGDDAGPAAETAAAGPGIPSRAAGLGPGADQACLLLRTSGTTSRPKLVPLTHRNLLASARSIARGLRLTSQDLGLNVMPLFHIHGLVAGLLAPLSAAGSVYCLPASLPDAVAAAIGTHPVTWYSAVPAIHQALADTITRQGAPPRHSLRFVRSCSAPLPAWLLGRLEELLGVPVIEAYGMTEASHQIACNPLPPGRRVPGSVGLPCGADVRILDQDHRPVPANEAGAVYIQGPGVVSGYLGNPVANEQDFTDSWFRTGDVGFIDDDGYLHLCGRTKELINRGGEKIFPREIDDVLMRHPDIEQALAFAIGHPRLGEEVAAAIVVRAGRTIDEREVQRFASDFLAPFKIPRLVVTLPELPTGPTGKPQRIGLAGRLDLPVPGQVQAAASPAVARAGRGGSADPVAGPLGELWSRVLGTGIPATNDNFYALGGDSLLAVYLLRRVNEQFGTDLPASCVSGPGSSPGGMAGLIAAWLERGYGGPGASDGPCATAGAGRRQAAALAPQQLPLWIIQSVDPESVLLNTSLVLELRGPLRESALSMALARTVGRHAALRSHFPYKAGQPCMVIADEVHVAVERMTASHRDSLPQVEQIIRDLLGRPFDISSGPVLRAGLIRVRSQLHVLAVVIHHLVSDAWSRTVFARDLLAHYEELAGGQPARLPPLTVQAPDVADWQARSLALSRARSVAYWRGVGAELSRCGRLVAGDGAARGPHRARRVTIPVSAPTAARLGRRAMSWEMSGFELLLGGLAVLLGPLPADDGMLAGVPISLRSHPELHDQVGYYSSMVPVKMAAAAGEGPERVVARTVSAYRAAAEHAALPLDELRAALGHGARGHGAGIPADLADVVIKKDVSPVQPPPLTKISATPLDMSHLFARSSLEIDLTHVPSGGSDAQAGVISFDYDTEEVSGEFVDDLAKRFTRIMSRLVA